MERENLIVLKYIKAIRPKVNKESEWFKQQKNLVEAIHYAAYAINSCGKRFGHQTRITRANLEKSEETLLQCEAQINHCANFDELFFLLEQKLIPIPGLGELYCYDTAFRLGLYLGHMPEKVYLHAGTRLGAKALGFDGKEKSLEVSRLPQWLHQLQPYEIEDVLCIFKDEIAKLPEVTTEEDLIRKSRCCGQYVLACPPLFLGWL